MIYTLTLFNPSLDYIVTVRSLPAGWLTAPRKEIIFPVERGINVSMVLKNLGFEASTWLYAGFTGMELKRLVADKEFMLNLSR